MQAVVSYSLPPNPMTGALAFDGEGTVRVERDALVLEGSVWRGQRVRYLAYGLWASFTVVLGVYLALVRPELLERPSLPLAVTCFGVWALCFAIHKLADRAKVTRQIRLNWSEVRGAAPFGLSMHLFTARGEAILSGPQVHHLGHAIATSAAGRAGA